MSTLQLSNSDYGNAAKVINLPDPSSSQDAATMGWVLRQLSPAIADGGDDLPLASDSTDLPNDSTELSL